LYRDYFIWCVFCTVVVSTCFVMCGCVGFVMCVFSNRCVRVCVGFVMCGCVYVWMFRQLCGCFGNMCTCIYCVLYCLYYVFVLFRLYIFILIC